MRFNLDTRKGKIFYIKLVSNLKKGRPTHLLVQPEAGKRQQRHSWPGCMIQQPELYFLKGKIFDLMQQMSGRKRLGLFCRSRIFSPERLKIIFFTVIKSIQSILRTSWWRF